MDGRGGPGDDVVLGGGFGFAGRKARRPWNGPVAAPATETDLDECVVANNGRVELKNRKRETEDFCVVY